MGMMDAMVSVFEHDTPVIRYGFIDDRNDGRGFAAGPGSFSSADGELLAVVEDYDLVAREQRVHLLDASDVDQSRAVYAHEHLRVEL